MRAARPLISGSPLVAMRGSLLPPGQQPPSSASYATWSGLSCTSPAAPPFLTLNQLAESLRIGRYARRTDARDEQGRIAVVASSGNLLESDLGWAIDNEAVVIRINDAPTAQHERDVGSRTSLRYGTLQGLTNALSGVQLSAGEVLVVQPGIGAWEHTSTADTSLNDSCSIAHAVEPHHPVALINTSWLVTATSSLVNGTHMPSTGFGALAFAVALAVRTPSKPLAPTKVL